MPRFFLGIRYVITLVSPNNKYVTRYSKAVTIIAHYHHKTRKRGDDDLPTRSSSIFGLDRIEEKVIEKTKQPSPPFLPAKNEISFGHAPQSRISETAFVFILEKLKVQLFTRFGSLLRVDV